MPWYGFTQYGVPNIPDSESSVSTGLIFMFPSSGALNEAGDAIVSGPPFGFLRCDGSNVLIADFQDLYDFFVDNLGSGAYFGAAPANYFKLPNMSGRFPIGLNTADTDVDVIGETGGASSHSHTVSASHIHSTIAHTHTVTGHTHPYGNHSHTLPAHTHGAGTLNAAANVNTAKLYADNAAPYDFFVAKGNHDHFISGPSDSATGSTSNPLTSGGADRDNTSGILATTSTTSTTDPTQGAPSSTITLASSGGTDSIPPYYSLYFVIKT